MTELLDKLKKTPLFKGLLENDLQSFINKGSYNSYKSGEMLFMQGDEASCFFLLLSGSIKLFKGDVDGKETVIRILQPGDIFAEIILYGNNKYPVNSQVIENSEVLAMTRDSFLDLLDNKELRDNFISAMISRLKYLTNTVHFLSSFDVEERFFKFFYDQHGIQDEYIVKMPKKEIANSIGTIPETFSRLLKSLKRKELITWNKNRLTISPSVWEKDIYK